MKPYLVMFIAGYVFGLVTEFIAKKVFAKGKKKKK